MTDLTDKEKYALLEKLDKALAEHIDKKIKGQIKEA